MDFGLPALFSFLRTFFVLLIALGLGAFLLFQILRSRRQAAACRHWPAATGRVLQSGTVRQRTVGHRRSLRPFVLYQYEVGGFSYQSRTIHPGLSVGGAWAAGTMAAKYPAGKEVPVYYNPQNPAEAVLEKGTPANLIFWIFLGLILVFLLGFLGISFLF